MGVKKIRNEFHEYAKGLERIKRDVGKIILKANSQTTVEDRLEDIIPCLKRILEQVVYGCLVIQIPVYGKVVSARRWQNKKASELVKMIELGFYPTPNPDKAGPYIKVTKSVRDGDALTREQWLTAWDFANQIQHVQNPASPKRKPNAKKSLDDALKWTQRTINLLSFHYMITNDQIFSGQVTMQPASPLGPSAQVAVFQRVTPWSPVQRLPDGSRLTLQRNENGDWKDVQDPKEGAIAVMPFHGIYTHRGLARQT